MSQVKSVTSSGFEPATAEDDNEEEVNEDAAGLGLLLDELILNNASMVLTDFFLGVKANDGATDVDDAEVDELELSEDEGEGRDGATGTDTMGF